MIDLHVHSTASDGLIPPGEIPAMAAKIGLTAVALTDHDTVDGVGEFLRAAAAYPPLMAVPGVELSVQYCSRELHFVGLFVDHENPELADYLAAQRLERAERAERMRARLTSLGYPITMDELYEVCGNDCPGRPHFAAILVRKFGFPDLATVFQKLLKNGAPGYVSRFLPPPAAAIRVIHAAGGVAVWAHPVYRDRNEHSFARRIIRKFSVPEIGLDAVEGYYSLFGPNETSMLLGLAGEYGIAVSGGSDYHGRPEQDIFLGTGAGKLRVPDSLLPELLKRRDIHREMAAGAMQAEKKN
ncbi:MAG: PHP domain-containing protein [Lentisphaeria bacterium]|nr:PHP domain-containing protein [Lentisphaeria bacterium]